MAGGEFDKDFGYLMPFIDKVAEAAGRMTDAAARAELMELVSGQRQRWSRIRELLSGAASEPAPANSPARAETSLRTRAAAPAPDALSKRMAETEAAKRSFAATEARSFTVGSLRPGRR